VQKNIRKGITCVCQESTDQHTHTHTHRRALTVGQSDRQTDGQTDGLTDGQRETAEMTQICIIPFAQSC